MKQRWETSRLAELCTTFTDGDWIESKDQSATGIRLIQTGNIGQGAFKDREEKARYVSNTTFSRLRCKEIFEGDCLVSRLPDPVGRSCLLPDTGERMITAVDCTIIRFDLRRIQPEFFNYYTQSNEYKSSIEAEVTGTTRKRISRSKLGLIRIPVPPVSEQRRIVAVLDEAFEAIAIAKANTEKNLQNARELFESEQVTVFSRRGHQWVRKTLGEIGKVSMCKRVFKEQTAPVGEIPFYKIGTFGKAPDAFISRRMYEQYRDNYPFPEKGDVLISAAGTIGRRVVFDGEDAYFQDSNIVWIAHDGRQIDNRYLYYFYGVCDWRATKGATIRRLYNDNLRRIEVAFPESLEEQRRIVAQFDEIAEEVRALDAAYKGKAAALDELKRSILDSAFRGALTSDAVARELAEVA